MLSERLVSIVARKKIVFVIVEGPSDDEALGLLLSKIYDKNTVYIHITHGDITTAKGVNSANILSKIGAMISGYAKSTHLTKTHFKEIVHIVDMDGAYIPDSAVVFDPEAFTPIYSLHEIKTDKPEDLRLRNENKSKCLDRISIANKVWGVPYQVYYMSCNLDHVLYDQMNSTDDQKEASAVRFSRKYKDDLEGFIRFISESDFSVSGGYTDSWKYIAKELHSLERHTNFGICIARAVSTDQTENVVEETKK